MKTITKDYMKPSLKDVIAGIENLITPEGAKKHIPYVQVALYVMVGGGLLGRTYTEQPQSAYIDSRARVPYPLKDIAAGRAVLIALAKKAGMDPNHLPEMPGFNAMGVF